MLGYFKYYDFFVSSAAQPRGYVGAGFPLGIRSIVLPVGISFFTFLAISYIIDIYRRELEPASLLEFAVYLSFFPHLVAGPDRARPASSSRSSRRRATRAACDTARAF